MNTSAFRASVCLAAAILAAFLPLTARAVLGVGDIVFDPAIHGWNIAHESKELIHWAEEIKKFEDFVSNQLRTIESLTNLRNGINSRLGDWQGVYDRAVSLRNRAENLKANIGANFTIAATVDLGRTALVYDNHGIYGQIVPKTIYGTPVTIDDGDLKRYQSVFQAHDEWLKSTEAAEKEIPGILTEIADNNKDIVAATSQEQVMKLTEKRAVLEARLREIQRQLDVKLKLMEVNVAANENREKLERDIRRRQLEATYEEARKRDLENFDK